MRSTVAINPEKVIFDFPTRLITDQEKQVLSKGLNFFLPPKELNYCSFLTPFELFYRQVKTESISPYCGYYPDFIRTKLKDIVLSGLELPSTKFFIHGEITHCFKRFKE